MSGHTPGPWLTVALGDRVKVVSDAGRPGLLVADVAQGYGDARLIAAAPGLLKELRRLVEICDREATYEDGSSPDTLGAHAAIAKAEGRSGGETP